VRVDPLRQGSKPRLPEEKLMTFDQFAEAMTKSTFLSSEEEQKAQIKIFEMGDEDLEEEEC
jgi:hypothetical protein